MRLRDRTGTGQHIDMAMHDALLAIQEAANFVTFAPEETGETDFLCAWVYRCGDRHVVVPSDPRVHWADFCALMEAPELAEDARYRAYETRVERLGELEDIIGRWIAAQSDAEYVVAALHARGMAGAKVLTLSEALGSEQVRARRMLVPIDDRRGGTTEVLNTPYRFSDAEAGVRGRPAYRGEDNRSVLAEVLAMDDAEIDALAERGVISDRVPERGPQRGGNGRGA